MVLPQRQTLLVARQTADVDLLSRGRLRLGVGVGWNYVEFDALGQDFRTRGKRMGEQIELLRLLWSGAPVDFQGQFDRIDRVALNPRPHAQIPIYCGGRSDPAYRRAVRLADGFIFGGPLTEGVLPAWQQMQRYLVEEHRPVASFGADYELPDGSDVETSVELIRRWEEAGGIHAAVRTMGLGFTQVAQHVEHIGQISNRLGLS